MSAGGGPPPCCADFREAGCFVRCRDDTAEWGALENDPDLDSIGAEPVPNEFGDRLDRISSAWPRGVHVNERPELGSLEERVDVRLWVASMSTLTKDLVEDYRVAALR